jgi:hypothetical protein
MPLTFIIPVRLLTGGNIPYRRFATGRRAKVERDAARLVTRNEVRYGVRLPLKITLTRLAPHPVDEDNLGNRLKHVQDGVADGIGLPNDRDGLHWVYAQETAPAESVRVSIEQGEPT